MNYLVFTTILNLVLIFRLRLLFRDEGAQKKDAVILGVGSILILPFLKVNGSWFILLFWSLIYPWIYWKLERNTRKRNRNRMFSLGLEVIVIGLLASPLLSLGFNALPDEISYFLKEAMLLKEFSSAEWLSFQILTLGLLLVINEVNILLRYFLEIFRLKPIGEEGIETDEREYNTGRLIGILERIFVFIFVLLGQYTAIGFILAAKGVARFQDFKSRTFAEYVLIGTLLSTLFAMIAGYLVMLLIWS